MKKYGFLFAFVLLALGVSAQGYFTAAGVRVGDGFGVTVQQRIAKKVTVEGIMKTVPRRDEFNVTGLVQRHVGLLGRHLNFYVGAGLHKGFINQNRLADDGTPPAKSPFGVTGVGGLELTLGKVNLSYDFKPALNLVGGERTLVPETALSLRYVIVGNKVYKKMKRNKKKKQRQKARAKRKKNGGGVLGIFN